MDAARADYVSGLFVLDAADKPEFNLGKWMHSSASRVAGYRRTFHADDCKDECPLNRSKFPNRREYFESFVSAKSIKRVKSDSSRFVYTSYGSGLLKQDLLILQRLESRVKDLRVNLIDQLYTPAGDKLVRDDFRVHDATIDFYQQLSKSFAADKLTVMMYKSAEDYARASVADESARADVLIAADCGPEIQKHFLILVEKSLKPDTGFWSVLFKYSDGSAEELKSPNLPQEARMLLKQRGPKSHCCIIYGKQDFRFTPQVYDLSNLPDQSAWVEFASGGTGQLKWDNRNLFNSKITLFAVEYWKWNYTMFMKKPPPSLPLCSAALSKRLIWVKKALKFFKSDVNKLSDESISPLHYAVANSGQPDVTEAKIVELLLGAGADPNIKAKGCGNLTCPCTVKDSTPLHWAALYDASESAKVLLRANGVNPTALDSNKDTPLNVATKKRSSRVAELLSRDAS